MFLVKLFDNGTEVRDYEMLDEPRHGDVIPLDGVDYTVAEGRRVVDGKAHWIGEAPHRSVYADPNYRMPQL